MKFAYLLEIIIECVIARANVEYNREILLTSKPMYLKRTWQTGTIKMFSYVPLSGKKPSRKYTSHFSITRNNNFKNARYFVSVSNHTRLIFSPLIIPDAVRGGEMRA